jgi:hypothetical protein
MGCLMLLKYWLHSSRTVIVVTFPVVVKRQIVLLAHFAHCLLCYEIDDYTKVNKPENTV